MVFEGQTTLALVNPMYRLGRTRIDPTAPSPPILLDQVSGQMPSMKACLFLNRRAIPPDKVAIPTTNFGQADWLEESELYPYKLVISIADAVALVLPELDKDVAEWIDIWSADPPDAARESELAAHVTSLGPDWRSWPDQLRASFVAFAYGEGLLERLVHQTPRNGAFHPLIVVHTIDDWRVTPGHLVILGRASQPPFLPVAPEIIAQALEIDWETCGLSADQGDRIAKLITICIASDDPPRRGTPQAASELAELLIRDGVVQLAATELVPIVLPFVRLAETNPAVTLMNAIVGCASICCRYYRQPVLRWLDLSWTTMPLNRPYPYKPFYEKVENAFTRHLETVIDLTLHCERSVVESALLLLRYLGDIYPERCAAKILRFYDPHAAASQRIAIARLLSHIVWSGRVSWFMSLLATEADGEVRTICCTEIATSLQQATPPAVIEELQRVVFEQPSPSSAGAIDLASRGISLILAAPLLRDKVVERYLDHQQAQGTVQIELLLALVFGTTGRPDWDHLSPIEQRALKFAMERGSPPEHREWFGLPADPDGAREFVARYCAASGIV